MTPRTFASLMQIVKQTLIILASLLFFTGCDTDHSFTYTNATQHKNAFTFQRPDGTTYAVYVDKDTDAQQLISLNVALGNAMILDAAQQTFAAQNAVRRDWLSVAKFALFCSACVVIALGTVLILVRGGKKL